MPKAVRYKSNSVVYFAGDFDDRVFLLNTGNVALTSIDVETGTQVTEYIKQGEFFGVKSALGNYPREENAIVLTDSLIYSFTSAEFDTFAQSNTRIIMQMIKVFSRQLRTIHRQVANISDSKEETNPEEGLFNVTKAFYNSQHYHAAGQVAERYKNLYPRGKYISEIMQILRNSFEMAGRSFGVNAGACIKESNNVVSNSRGQSNSAPLAFSLAEDLAGKQDWVNAYAQYHSVIESSAPQDITENAYIGAGKCLYEQQEYVRCLQLLTSFISQNPKSLKIAEALMYLGLCYQKMERPDKAAAFYDKAVTLAGPLLVPKIKELQSKCGKELK